MKIETITIKKDNALILSGLLSELIDEGTYIKPEEKKAIRELKSKVI